MRRILGLFYIAILIITTAGCGAPNRVSSNESLPPVTEEESEVTPVSITEVTKSEDNAPKKIAYITIDDGPSTKYTSVFLDILRENGVKATFFVLPRENSDDAYRKIIDEGHIIGSHSYSHSDNIYKSDQAFNDDLQKAKNYIFNNYNYNTSVYRFPGGSMWRKNLQSKKDILTENGYRYFDWDVTVADSDPNLKKYGDEDTIVNILANNVINNTKGREKLIILMHDDAAKPYTHKALSIIIKELKVQGYIFDVLTNYDK